MGNVKFKGIIPPMVTIFNEEGSINWEGNKALIDYLVAGGVHGIFVLGSSGEFAHLSTPERKEFAEFAVDYVRGRVPVLVGTGHSSTREVVDLSRHAQSVGADGIVVVTPYYWGLSEENLFNHYKTVASSVDLPVIIYHFPALTGQQLPAELVVRMVREMPNIVGIKDTIDNVAHIRELILNVKEVNPDFSVLAGFDHHLFNTLAMGGDGAIPGTANFAPEINVGVYEKFMAGEYAEALQLNKTLISLSRIYSLDMPAIGIIKEGLKIRGVAIEPHVRQPAGRATGTAVSILKKLMG